MTHFFSFVVLLLATQATTWAFTVPLSMRRSSSYSRSTDETSAILRSSRTALHMSSSSTSAAGDFELPGEVPEGKNSDSRSTSSEREMTDTRRQRLQAERKAEIKFVTGDDLHLLRQEVLILRDDLEVARSSANSRRILELERRILKAQQKDAEFVYAVTLERIKDAEVMGLVEEIGVLRAEACEARSALPHFNLDGLWVGKYGDHGYEMVNITYIGDTLIAYKATGDRNVPKGEISFKVDLNPNVADPKQSLEPVELGDFASKQWGTKFLSRYAGSGQVAAEGYTNPQFIEGQLIMVNEYFSFAWVPIGHQVFFGRPSAELTLKLLRDANTPTSETDKARTHLMRCLEETELLEDEVEGGETFLGQVDYFQAEGCFE